jgi:glycosyltransferase involved in cell wall biosynthesis
VLISVVVPTYNRAATLARCLGGLAAQTCPEREIIVVDDGGSESTAEVVAQFPIVRLLQQPHAGPAAARNRGIEAAAGEIVAFTDDDCLPPPDWLAWLAEGFCRHPEATGVGGLLLAPEDLRKANPLARFEAYVTQVRHGAGEREVLAGFNCPAGGTNNMAYRRAALLAVGGFDENFRYAAGEDADLKLRLAQGGALFLYLPVAVTHLQSYTWPAFRQQQFIRGKGRAQFDRKWGRTPGRVRVALRLVRGLARLALAPPPEAALFRPALEELWFNTLGQWAAIREMRG